MIIAANVPGAGAGLFVACKGPFNLVYKYNDSFSKRPAGKVCRLALGRVLCTVDYYS
jgi:hypothetical protein